MPKDTRNSVAKFISRHAPHNKTVGPLVEQIERASNSRFMTETIKYWSRENDGASKTEIVTSDERVKWIISRVTPPSALETLPAVDAEAAFKNLLALPGFDRCEKELLLLRKQVGIWQSRGADLPKMCAKLHAAVFSEDEQIAVDFAKHYQVYLVASGVIPVEQILTRADGARNRSMWSIDAMNGGMCLVANAKELSYYGAKELGRRMRWLNVVIIASYTGEGEQLQSSFDEDQFFLKLQLVDEKVIDPVKNVQDYVEAWMNKTYPHGVDLEGGFHGPFAKTFAERIIAKTGKEDERKIHARCGKELKAVVERQENRLVHAETELDSHWITREDLFGKEPNMNMSKDGAWKELHNMIGMAEVKQSLDSFASVVLADHKRAMYGQNPIRMGLSRLFIGPPGTGKTTVAKLYGRILSSLNVLSTKKFMARKASEFIGRYVGESEEKTRDILKKAKGKVLFIDEAYMLDPTRNRFSHGADPYRQGVIDTLVGEVSNEPGDDICVILAGYKDEMEHMLKHANPGLARRFPIKNAFVFEEFDASQLGEVLDKRLKERDFTMTDAARNVAIDLLQLAKQRDNFGNGGEVNTLLDEAVARYVIRYSKMGSEDRKAEGEISSLQPEDVDPDWDQAFRAGEKAEKLFDGLVGLEAVKERLVSLTNRASTRREAGHDPKSVMPFHFVFEGPRGTGKSTIAAKMGWLFRSMRIIDTDEVIVRPARDLIGSPMGGIMAQNTDTNSSKSVTLLQEAIGKILVIDEAHELLAHTNDQRNMLIQDARRELTDAINDSRFYRRVVVILVGRERPLDTMLEANPGLGSKFSTRLQFPGLTSGDCVDVLRRHIQKEGFTFDLTSDEVYQVGRAFDAVSLSEEWANYRHIRDIADELIGSVSEEGSSPPPVHGSDILQCLRDRFPSRLAHLPDRAQGKTGKADSSSAFPPSHETKIDPSGLANGTRSSGGTQDWQRMSTSRNRSDSIIPTHNDALGTYEYQPLPKGRYIRILSLQPADDREETIDGIVKVVRGHEKPIECTLETLSLKDISEQRLAFDALSYQWGNQGTTQRIICDGKILRVTRNCELALRYLRRKKSPSKLWIDAICINQGSNAERSDQVPLMGDVYKAAVHVYIWLRSGKPRVHDALSRLQTLCCLRGNWGEYEDVRERLFEACQGRNATSVALNTLMKNRWWRRMWTFQEFVVARRPVFVVGSVKIPWEEFRGVINDLISTPDKPESMRHGRWLQAKSSAAISKLLPDDSVEAAQFEAATHMFPTWVEAMDALLCRKAYQERLKTEQRPTFMSYFLLKTRNREAKDAKDKIYGLYYLFEASGYTLPKPNYDLTLTTIYTEVALALLHQSGSWWLLSHLFNRRGQSSLEMPSWVPDFSIPTIWHQGIDIRSQSLNQLETALNQQGELAIQLAKKPFSLEPSPGGVATQAVFLWTVKKATSQMPSDKVLDRCFEEEFEQTNMSVLEDALDFFIHTLADWLKFMEPADFVHDNQGSASGASQLWDDDTTSHRAQVMTAIGCAFFRSWWQIFWSLGKKTEDLDDSKEPEAQQVRAGMIDFKSQTIPVIRKILNNVLACIYPDTTYPCRVCLTPNPHIGNDAADHFDEWINGQGVERLSDLRYAFYSRAVDHALFQTSDSGQCKGHFGFCRNLPRTGDEIVLFPGLTDPVVVRKKDHDRYQIIGVTTGMVGPPVVSLSGEEIEGEFCFGKCRAMRDLEGHKSRSFFLV